MPIDNMDRRTILKASGTALAAATAAGCLGGTGGGGSGGDGGSDFRPMDVNEFPVSDLESNFNLWNWYDGFANYSQEAFAEEYDAINEINVAGYSSPSEWFTQLQSGNHSIDNIGATGTYVGRGMENDLLEPLPVENMPAWENIPQSYKDDVNEHFKDDEGNVYAVPESTVLAPALGYNTDYFDEPPTSWEILWDEDLEGQVTMWDRSYIPGSIAAKVAGQDWRDPDDFDELEELLIQQKPLNNTYWQEYQSGMQMFINEDVVAGMMTMGRLYSARFDNDAPIDYVVPEEGTMYTQDSFVIPKGAPNPRASTQFLDWAARTQNAVKLFTSMGYKPAVTGLENQLQEEGVSQEKIDFVSWSDDQLSRMDFQAPYKQEVREGYDEMWTRVKAA